MLKDLRISMALAPVAALAVVGFGAEQARALVVTVGGDSYDVTTFTGSYSDNISKFETAANGGVMPWWGSESLAQEFALAVNSSLGDPNFFLSNTWGSYFGYRIINGGSDGVGAQAYFMNAWGQGPTYNIGSQGSGPSLTSSWVWAMATPLQSPPQPVPAPLPLFGAAAAFGFSRALRRRIQAARQPLP